MLTRYHGNPLLTPAAIPPSRPDVEVVGVFNAGAARVGKKTVLVLRIAERLGSRTRDVLRIPLLRFRNDHPTLSFAMLSLQDPRYDFSDPSLVRTAKQHNVAYLTSLSHLRLAWSDDGTRFQVEPRPWLFPETREEAWGCEDARVTKIGTTYWVNYTAVSPLGIATALVSTQTFRRAQRRGLIFPPANRNVTIFPERIAGTYACFHRPMPSTIGRPAIWYASSPDLRHWGHHRLVALPRAGRWDSAKIGGGAPPIRTPAGWLTMYHGVDERGRYSIGALLTDLKQPWRVLGRSKQPLLEPSLLYETRGSVPSVCFPCGTIEHDGNLLVYYGAADRVMALASTPLREIIRNLTRT